MPVRKTIKRRTKIVCTLGPASSDVWTLVKMIQAGMDVARLNFSHGTHESHSRILAAVREAAERAGRPIGVLQDLCGPKIRVGEMPGGAIEIRAGDEALFCAGPQKERLPAGCLPVEYEHLADDVKPGNTILFDDGALEGKVLAARHRQVKVSFLRGGTLKSRKGMNLPGVVISAPSVTAKDLDDLEWGLANQVDFVALSFVRSAEDLAPVRKRLKREKDPPLVISKIERPEAVAHLDAIVKASDAVMVARGDLGVEMDFWEVPLIQKRLIRMANEIDAPVITATQMLESMTQNPRPTRAEASDVANAIVDGTDAVMLSGETASGRYPVEAVQAMASIAAQTDQFLLAAQAEHHYWGRKAVASCLHDALALGTEQIARSLEIQAIAVATLSGDTARYVASARPRVPIVGITSDPRGLHRMTLFWGVTPVRCPPFRTPADALPNGRRAVWDLGLVRPGDKMVLVVGRGPSREFSARIHIHEIKAR
jgi:pyruvate kinase